MNLSQRTTDLLNFLQTIRTPEELDTYLKNHTTQQLNFTEYYNVYLSKHQIILADAVAESRLEKHYAYQIVNGTKSNPSRTKVTALCLGAHMDLKETQRCLKLTKNASLYPKDMHDAIIITHINNGHWDVAQINDELWAYEVDILK